MVRIACSWNTSMPRSTGQNFVKRVEERPGLHQRKRGGTGADAQGQAGMVRPDMRVQAFRRASVPQTDASL